MIARESDLQLDAELIPSVASHHRCSHSERAEGDRTAGPRVRAKDEQSERRDGQRGGREPSPQIEVQQIVRMRMEQLHDGQRQGASIANVFVAAAGAVSSREAQVPLGLPAAQSALETST